VAVVAIAARQDDRGSLGFLMVVRILHLVQVLRRGIGAIYMPLNQTHLELSIHYLQRSATGLEDFYYRIQDCQIVFSYPESAESPFGTRGQVSM